jgi:hypothetical protein
LAEGLVVGVTAGQGVVLGAAEEQVEATLAEERVLAALAEQLVAAGAARQRVVAPAAEQVGRRQRAVDLAERDDVLTAGTEDPDARGLATVGVSPATVTAPLFTSSFPAALRLIVIELSRLSPVTVRSPALNVAVMAACAGALVPAATPAPSTRPASRRRPARRRRLRALAFMVSPLRAGGR